MAIEFDEFDEFDEFEKNGSCEFCKPNNVTTGHKDDIDEDFNWNSEVQCKCRDCGHFWFEPVSD